MSIVIRKAVAIDTNLLVALRATDLLLTPIQSRQQLAVGKTFDTFEEVEKALK